MKRILIFILSAILLTSCSDFLNIRPEGTTPSEGTDYTKTENIYLSVSAAYASLRSNTVHGIGYISAFEITSDNADKGSEPTDNPNAQEFDEFSFTPSNTLLNELWTGYYDVVSAANYAIEQMPLFDAATQNEDTQKYIRQCEGEAKAIRAYAYFNLTRMFGSVPVIDRTMSASELASQKQVPTSELYDFIEKDLKEAIEVLPVSYPASEAGKITKYTAMAFKAKAHMYHASVDGVDVAEQWDSVAVLTDKIIASGEFHLLEDFREVFSMDGENCSESLFEIQSSTLGRTTGEAPYCEYAYYQGPRGNSPSNMQGWGFCTPSDDLIQFFEDRGDEERAAATLLYRGTTTPEGDYISENCYNPVYNGKVYTPSSYNKWSYNGYGFDHNIRILRYSDVLLMYAEARYNGSTKGTLSGYSAQAALDEVRSRAGLSSVSAGDIQNIWDERRAEFALEEDRYFDLVRTGQAATVLASKGYVEGKHNVLPIPAAQRQLNQNLGQNPQY